jgi:tetratricopeptide (TPR) repeat protein
MTEGRLGFREDRTTEISNLVYQDLKEGLFADAVALLEKTLGRDLQHPGAASTLKCAGFWKERQERERSLTGSYEKGELYLSSWKAFQASCGPLSEIPERFMYALTQFVFTAALKHFLSFSEAEACAEADVLYRIGRCYKGVGNYGLAIEFLERANEGGREDAARMAELADCYSLISETRSAKVFFREAFFLDPQGIDIFSLESPMIVRLCEKVGGLGFTGPALNEWLPVYGAIYGVFNVKRELKPLELGKLKQSIFTLRKKIDSDPAARDLVPRLINRYMWLVDHYLTVRESREKIEEIVCRIRELDPRAYAEYAGSRQPA